jgi:hypothetical protein
LGDPAPGREGSLREPGAPPRVPQGPRYVHGVMITKKVSGTIPISGTGLQPLARGRRPYE